MILLTVISIHLSAQLKYRYENGNLNIPTWLTNKNYISENKPEDGSLEIEEIKLATFNEINIVEIRLFETQHSSGSNTIYLGTFGKNKNIIDITYVADVSSSDWNWQGELSFEEIEPGIIKYYCINLLYKPVESQEEQAEKGGMVLSKSDTTIYYYKIEKNGKIDYSNNITELKNGQYQKKENKLNESSENVAFDKEACILNIRNEFSEISKNLDTYQKKTKKSGENINLTYYYDGNSIRKIMESNPTNGQSLEYYFDNDGLIFIYTKNTEKKTESRYYFHEDKLFRWVKGSEKELISPESDEFIEKGKSLVSRSKILLKNE